MLPGAGPAPGRALARGHRSPGGLGNPAPPGREQLQRHRDRTDGQAAPGTGGAWRSGACPGRRPGTARQPAVPVPVGSCTPPIRLREKG